MYLGIEMAIKKMSADKTVVPNGTQIISSHVTDYVDRYRSIAKRTAESIIMLASTLVEAKDALETGDFEQFCNEVGLDQNGSTFRKLQKIGDEATRFQPVLDKLPNTWTTIYSLAKLEASDFHRIVDDGVLTPFMTASEVSGHIKTRKEQETRKTFMISVASLSAKEIKSLHAEIMTLQATYGFDMKVSSSLADKFK